MDLLTIIIIIIITVYGLNKNMNVLEEMKIKRARRTQLLDELRKHKKILGAERGRRRSKNVEATV